MKSKIKKLWGLGLIVTVLASLLIAAVPASAANPLQWNVEGLPGAAGNVVLNGAQITDLAVCTDGTTMYAATGGANLYKSTDGGATWTAIANTGATTVDLVAVAPDNNDMVVVADTVGGAGNLQCYVTTNGGNSWGSLGIAATTSAITDIDVSSSNPTNFLAVAGLAGAATPRIFTYNLGVGGTWTANVPPNAPASAPVAQTAAFAVKFSPAFVSDAVLTCITGSAAATSLQVLDMSGAAPVWNPASFAGYPFQIVADAGGAATSAAISLAPTYLGGDEVERVAFVVVDCATAASDSIYRLRDVNSTAIGTPVALYSVAYDGATLVAGAKATTTVWRTSNPMDTSPTFVPTSTTKSPGGATNACVAWAGSNVVAGAVGNESAFSVSTDDGASFNDIALINTVMAVLDDVAVSADGSIIYVVSRDAVPDTSVWRYDGSWQRVLTVLGNSPFEVRLAPDDPDVIYIADVGGTAVFYSKTGGTTKWYGRTGPGALADLAVESEGVAYYSTGFMVMKTANGGFTWNAGPPGNTKLGAAANSIALISEGNVIVAGTNGRISYTTDGNFTWNLIPGVCASAADALVVTASGLAEGDNIYAAGGTTAGTYRWTVGQAATDPWLQIDVPPPGGAAAQTGTGIALAQGILYQASPLATNAKRHSAPFIPGVPPPFDNLAMGAITLASVPTSLRVSTDDAGNNKLWGIDTTAVTLVSYIDTQVSAAPALGTPVDKFVVSVNPISGAIANVTFTWPSVAGVPGGTAAAYQLDVALDEGFGQLVYTSAPANLAAAGGPMQAANSVALVIPLNPGYTYYWRVKVSAPVTSPWSEVRILIVQATGAVTPDIGSPENGATLATGLPGFSWSPVAEATKYEFQLASDPAFANIVYTAETATTAASPTDALADGVYYWRVRAIEPAEGEWSPVATINVAVAAAAAEGEVTVTVPPITIPDIVVPPAQVTVEPAPAAAEPVISEGLLWAVIIIGAVLVIAVIVLIVRTRRNV